jgi:hypothetical protein
LPKANVVRPEEASGFHRFGLYIVYGHGVAALRIDFSCLQKMDALPHFIRFLALSSISK